MALPTIHHLAAGGENRARGELSEGIETWAVPGHGGSGLAVSASAMAWVGALHVNGYDNDAERFVRNVVTRFLDPAPITAPAAQGMRTRRPRSAPACSRSWARAASASG